MCFAPGGKSQGEEISATFLDVRGRPGAVVIVLGGVGEQGKPERKRARSRSCLALDLLRHGLGGNVFYECLLFQECVFMVLASFYGSGPSWVAGGRQEAYQDAK